MAEAAVQQSDRAHAAQQFSTFFVADLFFGVDVLRVQEVLRYQEMTLKITAQNATTLSSSSEELAAVSQQMAGNAEETATQANVVSAASEEVSRNVSSVASASEQMQASIREIAKNANERRGWPRMASAWRIRPMKP